MSFFLGKAILQLFQQFLSFYWDLSIVLNDKYTQTIVNMK